MLTKREYKGMNLAAYGHVKVQKEFFSVRSEGDRGGRHVVRQNGNGCECSCDDFMLTGKPCKHIIATQLAHQTDQVRWQLELFDQSDESKAVKQKQTYRQDWTNYNKAQTNEKHLFHVLLRDVCEGIEEPTRKVRGRKPLPIADAIFSAIFKVYSGFSSRRFAGDLQDAFDKGFIGCVPHFNSVLNVFDADHTEAILRALIAKTAAPLKSLESCVSADSSGFGVSRFDRWFDHKWGEKKKKKWVKCHLMCGVKTNVVTAVEILGQHAADGPQLPTLLETTVATFDVDEVSADMAYQGTGNLQAIVEAGATPYIPFKRGTTGSRGGIFSKFFHYFNLHGEEFLEQYHKRSNVESTFSMIKAKFGDSVRSKTDEAAANEVLAKCVAHNICCLIQSMYEFKIDVDFGERKMVV